MSGNLEMEKRIAQMRWEAYRMKTWIRTPEGTWKYPGGRFEPSPVPQECNVKMVILDDPMLDADSGKGERDV